jgi:methionyl-tRNA formyltransferase
MRIVLIGQAAFGEKVLQNLLECDEHIVGVFTPPDTPGKPGNIRRIADEFKIPVFQQKRMRDSGAFENYINLKPDLTVMAFVTDILPGNFLTFPSCGTIQFHPSLLPKHRGGSAMHWAIVQGETETGLTIFWPDEGIDTGPILLQKKVSISQDDTTGSLYFNKIFPLGVSSMVEAVKMVREGTAPRIPQEEKLSTYEPLYTSELAHIDWAKPTWEVYNLIRGCNPQPGAHTTYQNLQIKIYECRPETISQHPSPGVITDVRTESFCVSCADGELEIFRVQLPGESKINAGNFSSSVGLRPGDRFNL